METHLRALCLRLRESVDVEVVVANSARATVREAPEGVPVTRVASLATLASTPVCPGMARAIRSAPADVVHLHLPNPWALAAYLASGHRGSLVVTYHSDVVSQRLWNHLYEPLVRHALRRARAVIASSPGYLESSAVLRGFRDRCVVIPFGVDAAPLQGVDPARVREIRARHGDRMVLGVGRLVYYKGFEHLVEAMRRVDGRLVLVGDGPLREPLAARVRALGLENRVVLAGSVADVGPYYHAARVFALPSVARSEAFGLVQLEAMACGTPVVNTALPSGVPFVSPHGVTGLTVPPADAGALAGAINRLLDDPALRDRLGAAARVRATEELGIGTMVRRTLEVYHRAADAPRPRPAPVAAHAG
jgi:rhamnosyl/mannosyltransferase